MRALLAPLALALSLASTPAAAQDHDAGGAADITGVWSFRTDRYESFRCIMTGELELRPTENPSVFQGDLVANEACNGQPVYEARQTVVARRDGERLAVISTIVEVLPSGISYVPDNFELFIVNGALMVGELRSADIAPVTFRRKESLVS